VGGDPARWPSLAGQVKCAAELFGDNGFGRVAHWLAGEFDRVGNRDFDREFSAHVQLPGVAAGDYAHRIVTTSAGTMMGGIRFYGRDIARPFVEVRVAGLRGALAACPRPTATSSWPRSAMRGRPSTW